MDTSVEEKSRPVVAVLPLTTRPVASPKSDRKKKKNTKISRYGSQSQQRNQDHRILRGLGRIFAPNFLHKKRVSFGFVPL